MSSLKGKPLSQSHKEKIAITQRQRHQLNPMSEETRQKLSMIRKGKIMSTEHRQKIGVSQKRRLADIKICSQCSMKSKWIYGVIIRQIGDYMIHLCDSCLLDQYLNVKNNKKIEVVE